MWVPRSARHEAGERELALDPRDLGVGALNARPHCGIRHPAARSSVVVDRVLDLRRARNDCSHGGVLDEVLEVELSPRRAVDLRGVAG